MIKILFGNPLRMVEVFGTLIFLIVFISQIIWPLIMNLPLFPILSKKPRINKDIRATSEELEEEDLRAELLQKKKDLEAKRTKTAPYTGGAPRPAWTPPPTAPTAPTAATPTIQPVPRKRSKPTVIK